MSGESAPMVAPSATAGTRLWKHQDAALTRLREVFRSGKRYVLLVAPTGAGKTTIFCSIAKSGLAKGYPVLVVVHRRELLWQAVARLQREGIADVGVILAGEPRNANARVQVASIQTLLACADLPPAKLIVFDEAHHYVSDQWGTLAERYAGAWIVGVTATPERGDGTGLGDLFDAMVVVASVKELIDEGHLVPCDVVAPAKPMPTLAWDALDAWRTHAGGRQTVVFAEQFEAAGIPAAHVDGTTPAAEREALLARFASGEVRVLCNVYVLTEGWDCPSAEVCMIARGCTAVGTYLQMVGRVLRSAPNKARALLIDLRGVCHVHGLPDANRAYSLEGKPISGGEAPTKSCPECHHVVYTAVRACPSCDHVFQSRHAHKTSALMRISSRDVERSYLRSLLATAALRGYKRGWAGYRFRDRFGRFPGELLAELGAS